MLGPLPKLYRYLVCLSAIAIFVAGGVWAAFLLPTRIRVLAGPGVGLAIGALAAFVLLHDFDHRTPAPVESSRPPKSS